MALQKLNLSPETTSHSKIVKWFIRTDKIRVYVKDYQSGAGLFAQHYLPDVRGGNKWRELAYIYYNFRFNDYFLMRGAKNERVKTLEDIQRGLSVSQITQEDWEWYQAYMVGFKLNRKSK